MEGLSEVRLTRFSLLLLLIITVMGFVIAVVTDIPLLIGFMPGLVLLVVMVYRGGATIREINNAMYKGVKRNKEVIWLLGLIAVTLPAWVLSGTVNELVSFTLSWINAEFFFVLSFFATTIVSMTLGTAVGSLSVIGIPLLGAAHTLGLPTEVVAGAVISGAFVGDRSSPMSSAFQLLANTIEISTMQQFKSMVQTLVIGLFLTGMFYMFLDSTIKVRANDLIGVMSGDNGLLFLPPIILLITVLFRVKIRYAFLLSLATAIVMALTNGESAIQLLKVLWLGANDIGGLKNMILLIVFIALIGIYNEILEEWGILRPLFERLLNNSTSLIKNSVQTVGIAFIVALVAPNQSLPIVLVGRMLLPHWQRNFNKEQLARILGDSTMLFAGLVPWCMLAIMCSTITGVPVLEYVPYAAFLWIMPFITVFLSLFKDVNAMGIKQLQ